MKLSKLDEATRVFCAHEYTEKNLGFASLVEKNNPDLKARVQNTLALRAKNQPTLPSTIGLEKRTNPFLRPMSSDLQETLGMSAAPLVDVFAETRLRKDNF